MCLYGRLSPSFSSGIISPYRRTNYALSYLYHYVCASVRSIIPLLKLGDYLLVQAHEPCSSFHFFGIFFSCPVAGSPGPVYLTKAFFVQTDGEPNVYAYGTPPSPFCIYTSAQYFSRWNVFSAGALRNKLFFKCTVKFCTKLDQADGGPEEILCWDVSKFMA